MLKSKKFILAAGGLTVGAALLFLGKPEAFSEWKTFFIAIFSVFAGVNQLQKWIDKKK